MDCTEGKYASDPGAASCGVCGRGSHSGPAATYCVLCLIGRFADEEGTASSAGQVLGSGGSSKSVVTTFCKGCPAGKIGTKGNATSIDDGCSDCPVGTYQSISGESACVACPQGTFGNATTANGKRTSSAVSCIECEVGKYSEGTGIVSE